MSPMQRVLAGVIALLLAVPLPLVAQQDQAATPFKPEELDQLVAPIALYPDPLLAQILMASTYPLDVVQAARFAKSNASLKGAQLDQALQSQPWDDSVKSLLSFPDILTMMDAKLDWTQKLGDAFLGQQADVMNAVQRLRARAQAAGNLQTSSQQTVTVEPAAPAPALPAGQAPSTVVVQQAPPTVIKIEPANPQVVYVPTYNPTVVYGAWPYPAYPPAAYYPPGYVAGAALFSFAAGVAVGSALWGNCNWGAHDVNVNVNQYNNFTKNVNTANVASQRTQIQSQRTNVQNNASTWQHNPENRRGAQYRDPATRERYNKAAASPQATQARESFRGRADQGRQQLGGGATQLSGTGGAGARPQTTQARPALGGGGASQFGATPTGGGARSGGGPGAFEGLGQGRDVQQFSNRGQQSRQSMGAERAGGFQGRGATGGARAGGAAGGGRGRR
jgi:hypothetical protein